MKLNDVISSVYDKKWTRINNFSIILNIPDTNYKSLIGWDVDQISLNVALKSIDTPQYTNNPIEVFTGNEWRFNNGRDEMFRYTMTFRDYDQMSLYSKFVNMYNVSKDNYFDHIKLSVQIMLDDEKSVNEQVLFESNDSIIENISQLQFDHTTENQIAEFSVGFKCSSPLHKGAKTNSLVDGLI